MDSFDDRISSSWLFTILVDDKEKFRSYMTENEIGTDSAHVSNLRYSVFEKFKTETLEGLEQFDSKMMNIPCGWWLSKDDLNKVVDVINNY